MTAMVRAPPKPAQAATRTAEAMKRTTDISGFQDILDGAVAIDPDAAAREIGVIRDLIAGSGLEGQLDGMLHTAMLKHVATGAPAADAFRQTPAGEASTLTGGAGEDEILAQPQAAPSRPTPSAASFQGKEGDGRVVDPVGLSQEEERVRRALDAQPSDAAETEAVPPAAIRRPIESGEEPREYFEGAHDWLYGDEITEPQSEAALEPIINLVRWDEAWGKPTEAPSPDTNDIRVRRRKDGTPQRFTVPDDKEGVARLLRAQGADPNAKFSDESRLSTEEVEALFKDGGLSSLERASVVLAPDGYYHRMIDDYHDPQAVYARALELGRRHAIRFNRPLHEVLIEDMRFDFGHSFEFRRN